MPAPPRRPPMPKLPPFALVGAPPARRRPYYLLVFLFLFAAPLFAAHLPLLTLPFYWDEIGQFIPTALDLLRSGAWVARSTLPNVHPPAVEAYLVLWYKVFGFSIPVTRLAMLLVAATGLLITFLLSIDLSRGTDGFPAFLPPLFLLASPLFYTQSMMAQLDMPVMVFTLLALLLFIRKNYAAAAAVSVLVVLIKETGIVGPLIFFLVLAFRRDWKHAALFTAPAVALAGWLATLHHATGYWLGNPGFAHYNVGYALNPVRIALTFTRRIYYLFFAEFRWIGTLLVLFTAWKCHLFKEPAWKITIAIAVTTIVLVSVFGGAELERYILPVLPIFYIAVAIALTYVRKWVGIAATVGLIVGLIANLFWNPPWPFPYENNYAMVDFVRLQQLAARFADRNLRDRTIATAWPYTAALRDPEYGFVQHNSKVIETGDFHPSSIQALPANSFHALITFTRTWAPENPVMSNPMVRRFLARFYDWAPDITPDECLKLGLREVMSWGLRGQAITVYIRPSQATNSRPQLRQTKLNLSQTQHSISGRGM